MKKILIISFSNLFSDPRVKRQINALRLEDKVTAVGFSDPKIDGVNYIPVREIESPLPVKAFRAAMLFCRRYEKFYWTQPHVAECINSLKGIDMDLIIANDIYSLPIALKIKGRAKVLFDAHEYHPKEMDDQLVWRIFLKGYLNYLCKKYIVLADTMTTVCRGIAEEYSGFCGVKPEVITNAADYMDLSPKHAESGRIRLIHHGGAMPSRRIESMIAMMADLDDRFELDLMLVPSDAGYYDKLKRMAERYKKVRLIPPVRMEDIAVFLSQYDIGIYILEPTNFNNMMSLPNKFFEFIQARLAVAIGPSPEMARIVHDYRLGVVAADFTPLALAVVLNGLDSAMIDFYKNQSHRHARDLSSEKNMEKLKQIVDGLVAGNN